MKYEVEERNYGNYKNFYIKKNYFNIFSFYVRDSFDFGEFGHGFPILVSGLVSLAITYKTDSGITKEFFE